MLGDERITPDEMIHTMNICAPNWLETAR